MIYGRVKFYYFGFKTWKLLLFVIKISRSFWIKLNICQWFLKIWFFGFLVYLLVHLLKNLYLILLLFLLFVKFIIILVMKIIKKNDKKKFFFIIDISNYYYLHKEIILIKKNNLKKQYIFKFQKIKKLIY